MASFKKHSTGWEYRLRYKDPFTQKFKEKAQRGFSTKKEAQIAANEFLNSLSEGLETKDISLEQYLTIWIEEYRKNKVRKNTLNIDLNNINNHILPYYNKIMLRDINPTNYQQFLNKTFEKYDYSKRTMELIHTTMNNAMRRAVITKKISSNPCTGAVIPGKTESPAAYFIDSDDIPKFLQTAYQYGYIYWLFFKIMIETGLRKGEVAALQWSDIDFKNLTITVDNTLDFTAKDKKDIFGDPKTFKSNRIVMIRQSLANDLREHMKYQNQNKLALKELYHHDLNLVISKNDGMYIPKSSLFNAFSRILKKAGLPNIPIHKLRHTYCVIMMEAEADMKFIQEQLGHESKKITEEVYAHISKKLEKKNMKKFEEYAKEIFQS